MMATMEIALMVEDFQGDFEECSVATDKAIEAAQKELSDLGVHVEELQFEADFLEFDSSNPTHAAGYFEIEITGQGADEAVTAWNESFPD